MPGTPGPYVKTQWLDGNGDPYAAAQLFTYQAGTTTKVNTYTDQGLVTPNANPIVLDSAGRAVIYLDPDLGSVKYVLAPSTDTDPPAAPYWTFDNIAPQPFYSLSTTVIRAGTQGNLTASDNVISLTYPHHPIIVSNYHFASATGTGNISIPANTLAAVGDSLILEWEVDYASATLSARATMFGSNVDLGVGGASLRTVARYVVSRVDNTIVDVSQMVTQTSTVATAHTTITSLDLAATAYTVALLMASGTYTLRAARIFFVKGFAQWAT